jgi:hypothetical protein
MSHPPTERGTMISASPASDCRYGMIGASSRLVGSVRALAKHSPNPVLPSSGALGAHQLACVGALPLRAVDGALDV